MNPRTAWLMMIVVLWTLLMISLIHSAGCTTSNPC